MKKVLDWAKTNVLIVVLGAVAVAAIGFGWFFADSLNEGVRKTAKDRADKMSDLSGLEKSPVTLNVPGRDVLTKQTVINESLLAQYKSATEQLKGDAEKIRALALTRNQRDHKPVIPGVFPTPPESKKQLIAFDVQKAIAAAYAKLFADLHAGSPLAPDQVADALSVRESQFIQSTLRKANREALTDNERKDLTEDLTRSRLAIYGESAQKLTVYLDSSAVQIPMDPTGRKAPSMAEVFDWQWRFWITSDILHAVADASAIANGGTPGSVLTSPVKRIRSIRVESVDLAGASNAGGGSSGGGGSGFSGFGSSSQGGDALGAPVDEGTASGLTGNANQPLGAPVVDTATEAPRDYSKSMTGRQRNSAYDVRRATVDAIVATSELPKFFDALANRNFITVTNVRIVQVDPFEEAAQGFVYGREPVSLVSIDLETAWLREWIAPLMPAEVRATLGIQNQGTADAATEPPKVG